LLTGQLPFVLNLLSPPPFTHRPTCGGALASTRTTRSGAARPSMRTPSPRKDDSPTPIGGGSEGSRSCR
jgi:hypothetical protein